MGNFSRDTFKLTNILHQILSGESVSNPRHYVGVRLQQGVPVVDADWNELDDLRRKEMMAFIKFYIGDGVPGKNQGFKILASAEDNNFTIAKGHLLLDGHIVINNKLITYKIQPFVSSLPALSTPGADRTDLVYLDIWEKEIDSGFDGDSRIVDNRIGIETATRIEQQWAIRVVENAGNLSGITREKGHGYLPLALLNRRAAQAKILASMIVDLRKTGLTLAENLKIPLFLEVGAEILNTQRFTEMSRNLKTSLSERLRTGNLPYRVAAAQPRNEFIVITALQQVLHLAQTGEVQSQSRNLDNQDALKFMQTLYDVQKEFIAILKDLGNVANTAQTFITDYSKYLEGSAADLIKGLKPALINRDLMAAVQAQEALNAFLSSPVDILPEGNVIVRYKEVNPFEKLIAGKPYEFSIEIESQVANFPPTEKENFVIQATVDAPSWTVTLDKGNLDLFNQGGKDTVKVTVTPNAFDSQAILTVTAISARNSLLKSTQPGITLKIGEFPPTAQFLLYSGPPLNTQGFLEIPKAALTSALGVPIGFSIINSSTSENRKYNVSYFITPAVANTAGWSPLAGSPQTLSVIIPPNQPPKTFDARIKGPATAALDTTGNLRVTATLVEINGTAVAGGESQTVEIKFIVK